MKSVQFLKDGGVLVKRDDNEGRSCNCNVVDVLGFEIRFMGTKAESLYFIEEDDQHYAGKNKHAKKISLRINENKKEVRIGGRIYFKILSMKTKKTKEGTSVCMNCKAQRGHVFLIFNDNPRNIEERFEERIVKEAYSFSVLPIEEVRLD